MKDERVRVVDWERPLENDFLLVSQMTVTGQLYTCRPDLIGFVNGLPWVVIELKKTGVPARHALEENLTSYKHPQNGGPQLRAERAPSDLPRAADHRQEAAARHRRDA